MKNPFALTGKTIFITGAGSGIGRATAIQCAGLGATVHISDLNETTLAETLGMLEGDGHQMYVANLTDDVALQELVGKLPKLDGFVSNAGIIKTILTQFGEREDVEMIMNINTIAPIRLTQILLQNKRFNKEAALVYTSSMAGVFNGAIGNGLYGASKSALVGFVKSLALELAPRKIRVNTVNPGITQTNIYNNTSITQEQLDEEMKRYPLGRYGHPDEIASAIVYLLSDATKWMTGTNLLIDGGFSLQ